MAKHRAHPVEHVLNGFAWLITGFIVMLALRDTGVPGNLWYLLLVIPGLVSVGTGARGLSRILSRPEEDVHSKGELRETLRG